MIALAAGVILIIVLCFILFTPLVIEIDSTRELYQVKLRGIVRIWFAFNQGPLTIYIKTLWWKKAINIPDTGSHVDEAGKTPPVKRKTPRPSFSRVLNKAHAVAASFHLKVLYIDIDTGDFIINAWLFPLAWFMKNTNRKLQINYRGINVIKFKAVNNTAKLLWAIIT